MVTLNIFSSLGIFYKEASYLFSLLTFQGWLVYDSLTWVLSFPPEIPSDFMLEFPSAGILNYVSVDGFSSNLSSVSPLQFSNLYIDLQWSDNHCQIYNYSEHVADINCKDRGAFLPSFLIQYNDTTRIELLFLFAFCYRHQCAFGCTVLIEITMVHPSVMPQTSTTMLSQSPITMGESSSVYLTGLDNR